MRVNSFVKKFTASLFVVLLVASGLIMPFTVKKQAEAFDVSDTATSVLQGVGECVLADILTRLFNSATNFISGLGLSDSGGNILGSLSSSSGQVVPVHDSDVQDSIQEGFDATHERLDDQNELVGSLTRKEYYIDCIVWAASKELQNILINDVLGWINSANTSFSDSITAASLNEAFYVLDPSQFFTDLNREVGREFVRDVRNINDLDLPYKEALANLLEFTNEDTRTFTDRAAINIDPNFYNDFYSGGWSEYWKYISNPYNDPFVGAFVAQQSLQNSAGAVLAEQGRLLDYGDGFFPETRPVDGGGTFDRTVVTPAQAIKDQVSHNLLAGNRQIEESDEISELAGIIVDVVIGEIFDDVGSLKESY